MTEVLKDKKRLMEDLEYLIRDVTILNKVLSILKK